MDRSNLHSAKKSSQSNIPSTANTMKIYAPLSYYTALLGALSVYRHHVDGDSQFWCRSTDGVSLCGPKVDVAKLSSEKFLIKFNMERTRLLSEEFNICFPGEKMEIRYSGENEPDVKNIVFTDEKKVVVNMKKLYNPDKRRSTGNTECWIVYAKRLKELMRAKKLVPTRDAWTLDFDKFLELAAKGIYSVTHHDGYIGIDYAQNSQTLGFEDTDFKTEEHLRLPAIKMGETEYKDQSIRIRLGNLRLGLPIIPYNMASEWAITNGFKRIHNVLQHTRNDDPPAKTPKLYISIPGHPCKNIDFLYAVADAKFLFVPTHCEYWEMNYQFLMTSIVRVNKIDSEYYTYKLDNHVVSESEPNLGYLEGRHPW